MGIPTILLCCFLNDNIYVSLVFLGLEYLFAESWFGPAITMVVNTISPENKGFAVGAFLFVANMFGTVSVAVLNSVQLAVNAKENPKYYGWSLAITATIGYGLSIPFFYLAGLEYAKKKSEENARKLSADM